MLESRKARTVTAGVRRRGGPMSSNKKNRRFKARKLVLARAETAFQLETHIGSFCSQRSFTSS